MKKAAIVILLLVIVGGVVGAVVMMGDDDTDTNVDTSTHTSHQSSDSSATQPADSSLSTADQEHLAGADIGQTLDATDQTAVTVTLTDDMIDPTVLTIRMGTKVSWVNNGQHEHNMQPADGSPQSFTGSGDMENGDSYSFTFNDVGTYYYFCEDHPTDMRAIIRVVE